MATEKPLVQIPREEVLDKIEKMKAATAALGDDGDIRGVPEDLVTPYMLAFWKLRLAVNA